MVTPVAKREAAAHLVVTHGMSQRRACRTIGVDRAGVRYQATRPGDAVLRERLKALAQERRRFGYRRLHVLLRREGRARRATAGRKASERKPGRTASGGHIVLVSSALD